MDAPNSAGSLPLLCAARHGHWEALQAVLDHGAALEAADRHGRTPLMCAAAEGHVTLVDMLLAKGKAVHWNVCVHS